jgi:putative DNA primase/helicase
MSANERLDGLLPPDPGVGRVEPLPAAASIGAVPAELPRHLRDRLAEPPGPDRSAQTAGLVIAAVEWGLDDPAVLALAYAHPPTQQRQGKTDVAKDVGRLLAKHRPGHAHVGRPCDKAGCPNRPTWMAGSSVPASSRRPVGDPPDDGWEPPATEPGDQPTGARPVFRRTDYGNAERLAAAHGRDLAYCHPWSAWHIWDGRRWAHDDTAAAVRRAKATVRAIYAEAAAGGDEDERKMTAAWAMRSEARGRLDAMLALAASEPGIPVLPGQLDADPWLLNVANGTLDLRTGKLREHERADRVTKLAPVAYDPAADCPGWHDFLARILDGDAELEAFLQRAVGYSLTGIISEECLFLPYGTGRNGKSKFLEALRAMLGDYAQQAPRELLMARRSETIPNDIARLKGARLVTSIETKEGRRLDDALVKQLTGGDRITARFLHAEFFEFDATHKLWLATNHKPVISGTDEGIWSRIRLIPFTVFIPPGERDPKLLDKLRLELPGILAWAVQGCLNWQQGGLDPPASVLLATADYRAESDDLGTWLSERCVIGDRFSARFADLYRDYAQWCEEGRVEAVSGKRFGQSLTERGFQKVERHARAAWRQGVALRAVSDDHPMLPAETEDG